ncbi:MAG: glycosyltransferase family 2 protein [Pseudomonadales bacterium]|nr:glycosyltransferase family 2 protein [Candidatus Woesebacteria bacterium]MCB9800865.1 glycosyltransferase family 2 protein [Pseudomonadales bacterium]
MKKAIVIIPTYNERENIQKIVPALQKVFKTVSTWDMHVLVVDDTSPDKTYEVVKEMAKKEKNVHLLQNKQKAGLGGAYLKGMAEAFGKLKADVIFEFDADFSHDPERIPEFLKAIDDGADFVLGSRYIKGGGIPADWGFHRKFLSVVGNIIITIVLTNFSIRDWTTGYRAIKKEVYEAVHPLINSERFMGYTFQIGFLNNAVRKGFKVKEVPFVFVDRTIGESKLGTEYIKNTLLYIFKIRLDDLLSNRIFKFAFVGGLGTIVQLVALTLLREVLPEFKVLFFTNFLAATLLSIEAAIVSNFTLNNMWTFADRKLKTSEIPSKFLAFNAASAGSILIQLVINFFGETFIGLHELLKLPLIGMAIDTGIIFAMTGIGIGLFWNFFAYNFFIWKKK